jgi:hypothetical protein
MFFWWRRRISPGASRQWYQLTHKALDSDMIASSLHFRLTIWLPFHCYFIVMFWIYDNT